MSTSSTAEQIRQLVSENRLEEAIPLLSDTELSDIRISLSRRFNELQQKFLTGQLSLEAINLEKNQIAAAILNAAEMLENPGAKPEHDSTKQVKIWQIVVGIGVVVGIVALESFRF